MKHFEQATEKELRDLWEEKYGTPDIIPAEPLTDIPELRTQYFTFDIDGCVFEYRWVGTKYDMHQLKNKSVFPFTPEGKAGAEKRAKIFHPGMHWQDDVQKLSEAMKVREEYPANGEGYFLDLCIQFIKKYHTSNE